MTAHNHRIWQAEQDAGVHDQEEHCADCNAAPCACDDIYEIWSDK